MWSKILNSWTSPGFTHLGICVVNSKLNTLMYSKRLENNNIYFRYDCSHSPVSAIILKHWARMNNERNILGSLTSCSHSDGLVSRICFNSAAEFNQQTITLPSIRDQPCQRVLQNDSARFANGLGDDLVRENHTSPNVSAAQTRHWPIQHTHATTLTTHRWLWRLPPGSWSARCGTASVIVQIVFLKTLPHDRH